MTKNKTLTIIGFGSLFILFNLIVFIIPIVHAATFWIAYIFTSLSFFMMIGISVKVISSPSPLKTKFMNLSLIQIGYSYFISQLILGIVLFIVAAFDYDQKFTLIPIAGFILSATLLGFTISKLSFTKLGINEVERVENKVREKVNFIKENQLTIDQLIGETHDKELKKALMSMSEVIRFSDPMSKDSMVDLENEITKKINDMSLNIKNVSTETILEECNSIKSLLDLRNRKVKTSK